MLQVLFAGSLLLGSIAAGAAGGKCLNPPPVFDCNDWRQTDSGRLITKRPLTAGLLGMDEGAYIGDHTVIDGLDYSEALRKQCGGAASSSHARHASGRYGPRSDE